MQQPLNILKQTDQDQSVTYSCLKSCGTSIMTLWYIFLEIGPLQSKKMINNNFKQLLLIIIIQIGPCTHSDWQKFMFYQSTKQRKRKSMLNSLSSFQQTVPRTIFGYPEAICDKRTSSKPEVSWWSKQATIIVDFTARQKKSESSGN